jgi:hypothetical protein
LRAAGATLVRVGSAGKAGDGAWFKLIATPRSAFRANPGDWHADAILPEIACRCKAVCTFVCDVQITVPVQVAG